MSPAFRFCLILSLALLLTSTGRLDGAAPQTNQQAESPAARRIGRRLKEKGVPNFGEVTPNLYRGGLAKDNGLKALAKMGVEIVIDTRANNKKEAQAAHRLGMEYVSIPWHCPWPRDEVFAKFLSVLHENKGKKVFVHCRLGDDRTGMMVAAYRMADEGWTADEAMAEMKAFGFSCGHHFICPGLAHYEKEFPHRLRNNPAFAAIERQPAPDRKP